MIYKAIQGLPQAYARIKGSKEYPDIRGNVYLYEVYNGTVLLGELMGIPEELEKKYGGFFGFHIHEGNACTGDSIQWMLSAGQSYFMRCRMTSRPSRPEIRE